MMILLIANHTTALIATLHLMMAFLFAFLI
jgi:hypothetical protein